MDYTTTALVKAALGAAETTDDTLIAAAVTRASRAIDRHCAGTPAATDYFKAESVSNELILGIIDLDGRLVCCPHKPAVTAVTTLAYRVSPTESWIDADTDTLEYENGRVIAWIGASHRTTYKVNLSYTGGLGASVTALPDDLIQCSTVLAARFYKEYRTGLTDSIGIAELGTLAYTKAWPVQVVEMLKTYVRVLPW